MSKGIWGKDKLVTRWHRKECGKAYSGKIVDGNQRRELREGQEKC